MAWRRHVHQQLPHRYPDKLRFVRNHDKKGPAPSGKRAKALGAYYSPETVINFILKWAVRDKADMLIDPSFGDGQFLKAATRQGLTSPKQQIYGIELDEKSFTSAQTILLRDYQIDKLWQGDFFASEDFFKQQLGRNFPVSAFDAVVGNPPFIRYQRFKGPMRQRALDCALASGVALTGLSSSWAPFLVHATSLLKSDGRLAMVLPAELTYASYAAKVLTFLQERFSSLSLLSFQKRLFPQLSEDTLIVLGEQTAQPCLQLVDIHSQNDLRRYREHLRDIGRVQPLKASKLHALAHYRLSSTTQNLLARLENHPEVTTLAELGRVDIGYVTGSNDFFHLSDEEMIAYQLDSTFLRPCLRRSRQLKGLFVDQRDWQESTEEKKWLLQIPANISFDDLPETLQGYLKTATERGVRARYKVKKRQPWYSVPRVRKAPLLLSYMSHDAAKLVHNIERFPVPNTLHTLSLETDAETDIKRISIAWYTSLTFLSAELKGHSLGGGMLKLEPSEARRVRLALPEISQKDLRQAYQQIDTALRHSNTEAALDIGDNLILQAGLGLSKESCLLLRRGYQALRDRRLKR